MITCELQGPGAPGGIHNFGLGNLLFQIATCLSLAIDNNCKAIFPDLKNNKYGDYKNNILHRIDISGDKSFVKSVYHEPHAHNYKKIKYTKNMKMYGYFQSEKYFHHNRNKILEQLEPSDELLVYLNSKYPDYINKDNVVSLHVRRGDYVNLQDYHPLLTIEYYEKALNIFDNIDNIVVFSDDINWCKNNLKLDKLKFVEDEKDYIEMYLMSMIKNNIIANSSFSWWGAWLNNYPDRKIVAPNKWFGIKWSKWATDDLIPDNWIKI